MIVRFYAVLPQGQRAPDQAEPVTGKKLEDIEHMIKVQTKVSSVLHRLVVTLD